VVYQSGLIAKYGRRAPRLYIRSASDLLGFTFVLPWTLLLMFSQTTWNAGEKCPFSGLTPCMFSAVFTRHNCPADVSLCQLAVSRCVKSLASIALRFSRCNLFLWRNTWHKNAEKQWKFERYLFQLSGRYCYGFSGNNKLLSTKAAARSLYNYYYAYAITLPQSACVPNPAVSSSILKYTSGPKIFKWSHD